MSDKRVTKRTSNACTRCRKQKIKCSGTQPCETCSKRRRACVFDERDTKILVTQGYISDLQSKIASLESNQSGICSPPELSDAGPDDEAKRNGGDASTGVKVDGAKVEGDPSRKKSFDAQSADNKEDPSPDAVPLEAQSSEDGDDDLVNPLVESPSTYMSSVSGRTFYLGTSSNWSFSGRALGMIHEHVYQRPLPSSQLLFDGAAYDFGWDGFRHPNAPPPVPPVIPSYDHASYLINAVKFRCGQVFHLFDEQDFMRRMQNFYSVPNAQCTHPQDSLWSIHFHLLLAFGQAMVLSKSTGKMPAGAEFFEYAIRHLPDAMALGKEPLMAGEILCCIALYLQSIDHRNDAHVYIGQAVRTELVYGMHTDMPIQELGEHHVERCRKIWWTTYVLDRQMTSLMGLPQSVKDEDIETKVPTYQGITEKTTALEMQVNLSRIIAEINTSIYGANRRLKTKFLSSTKVALERIAGLADDLRNTLPLRLDEPGRGVCRVSAYIHLLYYQCIVLATRPLMFCCLKTTLEKSDKTSLPQSSPKICNLLQLGIESCNQIIRILESLQAQGLLETFLPFDLDSLYISTVVLSMSRVLDLGPVHDWSSTIRRSTALLDEMMVRGNQIAGFRKSEVHTFEELLSTWHTFSTGQGAPSNLDFDMDRQQDPALLSPPAVPMVAHVPGHTPPMGGGGGGDVLPGLHFDDPGTGMFSDLFTAEQLMAVADSIQSEDCEWMAHTVLKNDIW